MQRGGAEFPLEKQGTTDIWTRRCSRGLHYTFFFLFFESGRLHPRPSLTPNWDKQQQTKTTKKRGFSQQLCSSPSGLEGGKQESSIALFITPSSTVIHYWQSRASASLVSASRSTPGHRDRPFVPSPTHRTPGTIAGQRQDQQLSALLCTYVSSFVPVLHLVSPPMVCVRLGQVAVVVLQHTLAPRHYFTALLALRTVQCKVRIRACAGSPTIEAS